MRFFRNKPLTHFIILIQSVIFFGIVYNLLGDSHFILNNDLKYEGKKYMTLFNSIYYSLVTQALLGSGEVLPNSTKARICGMLQILVTLIITIVY